METTIKNKDAKVQIDRILIEKVNKIKVFWVVIDNQLNLKNNIKHLKSKLSRNISILNKAKHFLDHNTLHTAYSALNLQNSTYCLDG